MLAGLDPSRPVDAVFVNSPLKDYDLASRRHDFTLPVLGLGYIATYARAHGFNVAVLDAEAQGLGVSQIASIIATTSPRWVGLNLLAPTYRHAVSITRSLPENIAIMLGGHQAKAMPEAILADTRISRSDALILGEAEYRVVALLRDAEARRHLPGVRWRDVKREHHVGEEHVLIGRQETPWLAPDVNKLPFVDRAFLAQDPFLAEDGMIEANMVGSRGCPYDCSFCGAAVSANPDVSIRTRDPENILTEMHELAAHHRVTRFRFVDDLFLATPPFMRRCLALFILDGVGRRWRWDATGRINVLAKASEVLDLMREAGCREVALGVESGSERLLHYMGKHITPEMTLRVVEQLTARGIDVKGYFILGYPSETRAELQATLEHIERLWEISDRNPGSFRCSVFEFRPYPGTPEWKRLLATGVYRPEDLLLYEHVDLTGGSPALADRDEFNFAVNLQFGEVPVNEVRHHLSRVMMKQKQRRPSSGDFIQRLMNN